MLGSLVRLSHKDFSFNSYYNTFCYCYVLITLFDKEEIWITESKIHGFKTIILAFPSTGDFFLNFGDIALLRTFANLVTC